MQAYRDAFLVNFYTHGFFFRGKQEATVVIISQMLVSMYINASFLIYCDFFFWGTADPITIMVRLFKFGTSSQLYAFSALHQRWKKIKREMIWPRISEKNIQTLVY